MALFGNAHAIDPAQAQQDFARLLGPGEQVHAAYLLIRDTIFFTDRGGRWEGKGQIGPFETLPGYWDEIVSQIGRGVSE